MDFVIATNVNFNCKKIRIVVYYGYVWENFLLRRMNYAISIVEHYGINRIVNCCVSFSWAVT
jgi:hypothetical protein